MSVQHQRTSGVDHNLPLSALIQRCYGSCAGNCAGNSEAFFSALGEESLCFLRFSRASRTTILSLSNSLLVVAMSGPVTSMTRGKKRGGT